MATERELVALLHHADWTRLSLSGEVHGADEWATSVFTETRARPDMPFPPHPPFPPPGADVAGDLTLLLAPGKRYRTETADGRWVKGCDGERIWEWFAELPPSMEVRLSGGPQPPFPKLLAPSWLLSGYELSVGGEAPVCGRASVRVAATARRRPGGGRIRGMLPVMPFGWPDVARYDHVDAVVDAELGILLRCEGRSGDHDPELTEFRTLTVNVEADPARFTAPPGSVFGERPGSRSSWSVGPFGPYGWPFGEAGREAAKAAAGLAAGGLGAAIKYSPRKRQDPFARATQEDDPEAAMPDDPFPAPAADRPVQPVSDEVLHLLYRSGTGVPRFTAALHQWLDFAALLEAVPESARKTGFGGVGFLVDAVRDAALDAGTVHVVRSVLIVGWDKYRIDLTRPAWPREQQDSSEWRNHRRAEPLTVACDGQRRWEVYTDRVVVGPASPLADELGGLVDGSRLLGCDLSGGEEITVGGLRGYRVAVEGRRRTPSLFSDFFGLFFPAVAVVDAESGRFLRFTQYKGGKPVVRLELRDIVPDKSDDFGFEPPAGLPVVEKSDEDPPQPSTEYRVDPLGDMAKAAADAVKKRVDEKMTAARGFFDSLRGAKPPADT
jgi:hypothetical protein